MQNDEAATEYNRRICELSEKISHDGALVGFAGNAEAEEIVAQTIHASVVNLGRLGVQEAVSFKGSGLTVKGRTSDNPDGLRRVLDRGWLVEEARPGLEVGEVVLDICYDPDGAPIVLRVTEALLDALEKHLQGAGG